MNSIITLANSSSQDDAYNLIKGRILSFSLRPGERVKAHEVAVELGTSRTPVREALGRLEQEGLVARDSGWGYLVKGMTFVEVVSLFKVREVLEIEAAKEALINCDGKAVRILSGLLKASERHFRANKISEFQKANRSFHAELERLSANVYLINMLSTISDRIRILGAMVLRQHSVRGDQIIKENQAILAAIEKGDMQELEAAVRLHVRRAGEHVMHCLQGDLTLFSHNAVA